MAEPVARRAAGVILLLVCAAVVASPDPGRAEALRDTPHGEASGRAEAPHYTQAGSPSGAVPASREAHRDVLNQVLQRPEFQRSATAALMDQVRQRLTRWLADLWERMGGSHLGSRSAATGFAWVIGILALAALAWWLVQSLWRRQAHQALGLAPPPSRRRPSRAWAREALAAHRAGDAREAARCAYHAAVARLEEEGAWRQDDARTPREYLRLLPAVHRRRGPVTDLTMRFERAWYGTDRGTPEETRLMLTRLQELGCLASDQAI